MKQCRCGDGIVVNPVMKDLIPYLERAMFENGHVFNPGGVGQAIDVHFPSLVAALHDFFMDNVKKAPQYDYNPDIAWMNILRQSSPELTVGLRQHGVDN